VIRSTCSDVVRSQTRYGLSFFERAVASDHNRIAILEPPVDLSGFYLFSAGASVSSLSSIYCYV
jgi:hypothetical protein